jgi:hypothetical protein
MALMLFCTGAASSSAQGSADNNKTYRDNMHQSIFNAVKIQQSLQN